MKGTRPEERERSNRTFAKSLVHHRVEANPHDRENRANGIIILLRAKQHLV